MTQINLLPWREQARQTKKILFGISILGACSIGLIVIFMVHLFFMHMENVQIRRTSYMQAQLDQFSGDLTMLIKKKKEEVAVITQLTNLVALRESSYQAVRILDQLARDVPKTVQLETIMRDGSKVTLTGEAETNANITLLMTNLAKSDLFKQPDLTEISGERAKAGNEHSFELKVEVGT